MPKYRLTFDKMKLKSVDKTEETTHTGDTILEEQTGETIYAFVEAKDEEEAREKAQRVAVELQSGVTKRDLENDEDDVL